MHVCDHVFASVVQALYSRKSCSLAGCVVVFSAAAVATPVLQLSAAVTSAPPSLF
jgi:hypothetical protein